jgi:hypothetical protein
MLITLYLLAVSNLFFFKKTTGALSFIKEEESRITNYRYKSYLNRHGKIQHKRRHYHQRLQVGRLLNGAPDHLHL